MILSIANKIASIANLTPTKSSQPSALTDNNTDTVPMELEPQSDITTNTNTTTSTSSIEPETNPTLNDETDASNTASTSSPIKSILKPKTLSLEPKDIRARAKSTTNTPRKVQFTVVDGAFGGRGKTEYTRCPSRKSHTRRPLPPGHFDTDSDSTATETDQNPQNNSNFSLLDTLNSQKFCQNSRLIKLVRRKKKKKDKELQWLAMISPEIGFEGNKTKSRITFGGNKSNLKPQNMNSINITTTNNAQTQNNAPKAMDNAMSNTMNSLLSMKAPNKNKTNVNRFKSPYKSPSASMSRGRRALYKAQKAKQNRMNNTSQNKQNGSRKIQNTPIVKGTPIVQKVTKMAAIRMASLDQINEDRDNGNDGDDDDDDIMMNNNNNNGSVPPQDVINNTKKKTSSSELSAANNDKEERKDNSHENSPKQAAVDIDIEHDHDQDPETLSDEMKTDDKNHGNSLDIAYEDDEDDDLILDDLRHGTTKSGAPNNTVSIATTKPVIANINSLFMPKNKSDITNDDHGTNTNTSNSNRNNTTNNPIPNTRETITDNANRVTQVQEVQNNEAMQSKSPSEEAGPQQKLNFNLTSPMRSAPAVIPASPQMTQQSASTATSTSASTSTSTSITTSKMSPMDFARGGREINLKNNRSSTYLEQHSFSVGLGCGNSNASYSRSIATQTESVPCEIGIQVNMNADNMNDLDNETPFVIMKDKPIIITTSTGSRFMRITNVNQIDQYQMIPMINDQKEPEDTPELQQDHDQDPDQERDSEPVNHFGSVSESENDEDVVMNDHDDDKDKSPSTEPEAEMVLVPTPEVVKVARAMVAANKAQAQSRELSPVIEEEHVPGPEAQDAATATATATTDIDIVSNATEIDSNQSEADKPNETPPPEQGLQSLSLNIQHAENAVPIPVPVNDENHGINAQISNNKSASSTSKNRAHLKRKYDEALASDNEQDEDVLNTEHNPEQELPKEPTPIKRRKVTKTTKSKRKRAIEKRIKYQKKDIVWSLYEGLECPTIILSCFYDGKEKFYPSGYQILWLNFIDTEGARIGQCSITEEPYTNIKSKITGRQLEQRLDEQDFVDAAWSEIKKHRADIHKKYKVSRGRLMKSTKPKKIKRKRRASVM